MAISLHTLANAIGLSLQTVEAITDGKQNISPSTALRLAKFFGTTHDFWLNLQRCWDIFTISVEENSMRWASSIKLGEIPKTREIVSKNIGLSEGSFEYLLQL
jgi:addiction module HigA family antidote